MIYLDISRLLRSLKSQTPTGIDRVEFVYAHHLLNHHAGFVAQTSQQIAQVPYWLVRQVLEHLHERWQQGGEGIADLEKTVKTWERINGAVVYTNAVDRFFLDLVSRKGRARWKLIQSERKSIGERAKPFPWPIAAPALFVAPKLIGRFISPSFESNSSKKTVLIDRVTSEMTYLNVGHSGLERREILGPLSKEEGMSLAFYIHDMLPITHPTLFEAGRSAKHQIAMENMVEFADHIFTNSNFTKNELERIVPAAKVAATLEIGLSGYQDHEPVDASQRRGFVAIGTIEPRKNFLWLVNEWTRFCADNEHFVNQEVLTIFGKKGWIDESSYAELVRAVDASDRVRLVSGASDRELADTLCRARAYLSAAHVEGWGMPIAESLILGTPAVVTDVAAHREVTQGVGRFFEHGDQDVFQSELTRLFDQQVLSQEIERTQDFVPWSWEAHFLRLNHSLKMRLGEGVDVTG